MILISVVASTTSIAMNTSHKIYSIRFYPDDKTHHKQFHLLVLTLRRLGVLVVGEDGVAGRGERRQVQRRPAQSVGTSQLSLL